jgi:hypothetical protein
MMNCPPHSIDEEFLKRSTADRMMKMFRGFDVD